MGHNERVSQNPLLSTLKSLRRDLKLMTKEGITPQSNSLSTIEDKMHTVALTMKDKLPLVIVGIGYVYYTGSHELTSIDGTNKYPIADHLPDILNALIKTQQKPPNRRH